MGSTPAVTVKLSIRSEKSVVTKACAIISQGALVGARHNVEAALTMLRAHRWDISEAVATNRFEVTNLAQRAVDDGCEVILAVGGDGTFAAVAGVLAHSDTILAPLPAGTANGWAREMGLPIDVCRAASLLPTSRTKRVDVGVVNTGGEDHAFLATAGVGYDAAVIRDTPRDLKRWLGIGAYAFAAVCDFLGYDGALVDISAEGIHVQTRALLVSIGNTRTYGGVLTILPAADNTDGLLDVCVFRGHTLRDKVLHVVRVLCGRHTRAPNVSYLRATQFVVDSEPRLPVHADGDYVGTTPITVICHRQALNVLLPIPATADRWR